MTMNDPNDPRGNMGPSAYGDRAGWSGTAIAAAVAILLLAGLLLYSFSGDRRVASGPGADATTGQATRTTPTPAPAPAPTTPAPAPRSNP